MIQTDDTIVKETYEAGEMIFSEGDLESHFYIVETGIVQIFTTNDKGERLPIIQISDGESFGEFALLDNKPRSASAQAIIEVHLVRVSEEGFRQLMEEIPVWASSMMKSFVDRLKNLTTKLKG